MAEEEPEEPVEPETGSGAFLLPDGSKYDGEWRLVDGARRRDGHGRYIDTFAQTYEGEWSNDKMHGRGRFRFATRAVYEGEFVENAYSGSGKYTFPDGSYYEGGFTDGQMHGPGAFTDAQGVVWAGKFYMGCGPGVPGTAAVVAP
mmetsp:Transcript_34025/g.101609  ORF Transcript_34025/g.101609 Transcript_34025/m.101609 type:complete len:145 (-) Transcript_34025:193-627(-)